MNTLTERELHVYIDDHEGKIGVCEIHSCIYVQLYRNAACTGIYVMVWYGYENEIRNLMTRSPMADDRDKCSVQK